MMDTLSNPNPTSYQIIRAFYTGSFNLVRTAGLEPAYTNYAFNDCV